MKKELSWQIKLKNQKDFSSVLLWALGILTVSVAFIFIFRNYLGSLAILALGALYLRFYFQVPIEKEIILSSEGLKYGELFFNFTDFLSFALIKIRGKDHILFRTTSRNMPELVIDMPEGLQKEKILEFLSLHLPRQKKVNTFDLFHLDSYLGI